MSLTTPSLVRLAVRRLVLFRSIWRLTAFWLTPWRLSWVASSSCLVESRVRRWLGMVGDGDLTVLFSQAEEILPDGLRIEQEGYEGSCCVVVS